MHFESYLIHFWIATLIYFGVRLFVSVCRRPYDVVVVVVSHILSKLVNPTKGGTDSPYKFTKCAQRVEHFVLLHILINCTFHNYFIIFFYCFFSIKQVDTHAQWAHLTAAFVANYKHNFTYFSHFFQRETLECCCCCCCWGCTAATSEASTVHSLASCRCDWASPRQVRSEQVSVASSSPSQSQSASALRRQRLRLRISSLQFDLALWFSACWIRRVFNSLCVWVNITDVHTHTHTPMHTIEYI